MTDPNPLPAPTVLTLTQRGHLLELLEREEARLEQEGQRLDAAMRERWPADAVIDEDDQEYDQAAVDVDRVYADVDAVAALHGLFDAARIVRLRETPDRDVVSAVARLLVSAWEAGADVGAVMVAAAAEAQRTVHTATEEYLTSNRSGSWEASLLEQMVDSSGWDR